ncbi:hypothetical protein NIES2100_64560 [Calothrix sp. NIES-2100]|nr:hypothetical protein NIES2100_64560 [Calothrix sp. NIES-2100]
MVNRQPSTVNRQPSIINSNALKIDKLQVPVYQKLFTEKMGLNFQTAKFSIILTSAKAILTLKLSPTVALNSNVIFLCSF